ncbi:hypothetical protein [Cellulomonas sp. URHB0016]
MTDDLPQLTQEDVTLLRREGRDDEIVAAKAAGRLNALLGMPLPFASDHLYTLDDLQQLHRDHQYEQIAELRQTGRLEHLFNPEGA